MNKTIAAFAAAALAISFAASPAQAGLDTHNGLGNNGLQWNGIQWNGLAGAGIGGQVVGITLPGGATLAPLAR